MICCGRRDVPPPHDACTARAPAAGTLGQHRGDDQLQHAHTHHARDTRARVPGYTPLAAGGPKSGGAARRPAVGRSLCFSFQLLEGSRTCPATSPRTERAHPNVTIRLPPCSRPKRVVRSHGALRPRGRPSITSWLWRGASRRLRSQVVAGKELPSRRPSRPRTRREAPPQPRQRR